jgi:hypothetical protein
MYNRLKPGQPRAKEAIEMENTGVTCDVCECRHNVQSCKCDLPQIKVTEHCSCTTQQVETPHYCQNYEKK